MSVDIPDPGQENPQVDMLHHDDLPIYLTWAAKQRCVGV